MFCRDVKVLALFRSDTSQLCSKGVETSPISWILIHSDTNCRRYLVEKKLHTKAIDIRIPAIHVAFPPKSTIDLKSLHVEKSYGQGSIPAEALNVNQNKNKVTNFEALLP